MAACLGYYDDDVKEEALEDLVKKKKYNYVFLVMDFEFVSLKHSIMLVSGAIATHGVKSKITKLEGNPLSLRNNGKIRLFEPEKRGYVEKFVNRILRKKKQTLSAVLEELRLSFDTKPEIITLCQPYIANYINRPGNEPVIVLWNGSFDLKILNRLHVTTPLILNLTMYDDYNNGIFYLKLLNPVTKKFITKHEIGYVNKNGRLLSLSETHMILCSVKHNITYVHDPVVDVLYTRCIFNYLVKREGGYDKLLEKLENMKF